MKTAIIFYSGHYGNTGKLIDRLAAEHDITTIDAAAEKSADLSEYDLIGFASGIYYSGFHRTVLEFAKQNLPQGKNVFFLFTCGMKKKGYTKAIREAVSGRGAQILGEYGCRGFDTFGPFRLIGGIAKGHPDKEELDGAAEFYRQIIQDIR